jgi:hypothetical protein
MVGTACTCAELYFSPESSFSDEAGARWHHHHLGGHGGDESLSWYLMAFVCIPIEQAEWTAGGGGE